MHNLLEICRICRKSEKVMSFFNTFELKQYLFKGIRGEMAIIVKEFANWSCMVNFEVLESIIGKSIAQNSGFEPFIQLFHYLLLLLG